MNGTFSNGSSKSNLPQQVPMKQSEPVMHQIQEQAKEMNQILEMIDFDPVNNEASVIQVKKASLV